MPRRTRLRDWPINELQSLAHTALRTTRKITQYTIDDGVITVKNANPLVRLDASLSSAFDLMLRRGYDYGQFDSGTKWVAAEHVLPATFGSVVRFRGKRIRLCEYMCGIDAWTYEEADA